jgi:enamine deaminase RidA (YjgF/YER057c/UK114 family)
MFTHHTPPSIRPPFANYAHGVEVAPGARWLFVSGQLGIGPDDHVPADTAGQARLCFQNIAAVLASAGMGLADIVRLNATVAGREHLADYMKVRDEFVTDPAPASTLMIVTGFAREIFNVEIEVVAAKV